MFTSLAVMEAGRLADDVVFEPGFVRGGPTSISDENWSNQLDHMLARDSVTGVTEPECWMYHQASFMLKSNFVPPSDQIGRDIDFFVLPPIDPTQSTPITGTTGFAAALVDRPEVRAFMEFLASPEWGNRWAVEPGNDFISPNARFDLSNYGDVSVDPAAAVRRKLAEAAEAALQSDSFRIDASDLMPQEIGGSTFEGGPGAFWRAMINWVDGKRSIDEVFADIDAEWACAQSGRRIPPPT